MLKHLSIHNVVLIDALQVDFEPGLTVLTGETGAGKSILLDALGLALGMRADPGLIRVGASQATVSAIFSCDTPDVDSLWSTLGLPPHEGTVMLRRTLNGDRSSKAFLNDHPVTVQTLRKIAVLLVDVHGQFDGLETPEDMLQAVDLFCPHPHREQLRALKEAHHLWQESLQKREDFLSQLALQGTQYPLWQQQLKELKDAHLKPDEFTLLNTQKQEYADFAKVKDAFDTVSNLLTRSPSLIHNLHELVKPLERIQEHLPSFHPFYKAVDHMHIELQELKLSIHEQLSQNASKTKALEALEERLYVLHQLAKKHQCTPETLLEVQQKREEDINSLKDVEAQKERLEAHVTEARKLYYREACTVSEARQKAAGDIAQRVNQELPALKLDKAHFSIALTAREEEQWRPHGIDHLSFLLSTHPGATPGPLTQIASGGEQSRLQLALKLTLAGDKDHQRHFRTFVFDEVDAGIGGATADAVGDRLLRLAQSGHQVIVITHSPQVAAKGGQHFHVVKTLESQEAGAQQGVMRTSLALLDTIGRQEEIARMLSGSQITEQARAAAAQLLGNRPRDLKDEEYKP